MSHRQTILIVDDAPENLEVLGNLLGDEYEVRIASNGSEALETVKSSSPNLILLDIVMPGMGGYEVCRRLKADADLRVIPVIFISGLDMPEQKIQAFREGAVDYITKPFQSDEVAARVRTHLQLSKLEDLKREIAERRQAEEALKESEERYRRITHAVTDYIFTSTVENGQVVKTVHGPGCVAVTGYSAEEFAADPYLWFNMVHREDRSRVRVHATSIVIGRDFAPIDHRIRKKDGWERWVLNTPVLHHDSSGTLISYDGLIRDITDRKLAEAALRESEEQFRLLAENSTDMISRHDAQGNYLYASPACRVLLGYEPEELVGHSALEFVHPDDIASVDQSRSTIIDQPIVSTTIFRVRRKNGEYIWLETISHAIIDKKTGTVLEIHSATRDITARKRMEEELKERMEELVSWHELTIGREGRVMELKNEVNELMAKLGQPPRYESLNGEHV